eukprot:m51a1_g14387 hypothetical protein (441) ;mRNA; f:312734-314056
MGCCCSAVADDDERRPLRGRAPTGGARGSGASAGGDPVAALEALQPALVARVRSLLRSFDSPGVYDGEPGSRGDPAQWAAFLDRVAALYDAQLGCRGDEKRRARGVLRDAIDADPRVLEALETVGCTRDTDVDVLATALERVALGGADAAARGAERRVAKLERFVRDVDDDSSPCARAVAEGLRRKGAPEGSLAPALARIRAERVAALQAAREEHARLCEQRDADETYRRAARARELLGPVVAGWRRTDVQIGHDNTARGVRFERLCRDVGVRAVWRRLGLPDARLAVRANATWRGVAGEVDFALLDAADGSVRALVECKASLFDVSAADAQSGPHFRRAQRKSAVVLAEDGSCVAVPEEAPCYVVTVIPPHELHLGFETKLREPVTRALLARQAGAPDAETLALARAKVAGRLSPADWLDANADRLIVFPCSVDRAAAS